MKSTGRFLARTSIEAPFSRGVSWETRESYLEVAQLAEISELSLFDREPRAWEEEARFGSPTNVQSLSWCRYILTCHTIHDERCNRREMRW
jgi:hypothetical protein